MASETKQCPTFNDVICPTRRRGLQQWFLIFLCSINKVSFLMKIKNCLSLLYFDNTNKSSAKRVTLSMAFIQKTNDVTVCIGSLWIDKCCFYINQLEIRFGRVYFCLAKLQSWSYFLFQKKRTKNMPLSTLKHSKEFKTQSGRIPNIVVSPNTHIKCVIWSHSTI